VIRSNVELVADDPDTGIEDWRRAGAVIRRNAERMSEMIAGLLATARLQTHQARSVSVDLGGLVQAKVADFSPIAAKNELDLKGRVDPVTVSGVEVALDRALSNLIENAVKVAPAGSVVEVGSGSVGDWAWVGVRDGGPGLSPASSDRVGLGLSIVTQIAKSHGGSLAAFPGSGSTGTTMVMWIPLRDNGSVPPSVSPFTKTS
jgi:signal transduction histidine kinase